MFRECWQQAGLVLLLAAGVCLGQDKAEPDKERALQKAAQARPPAGRRPVDWQLKWMAQELELDSAQVEAVRSLLEESWMKTDELRRSFRPSPQMRERMKEIRLEMKAAREAGDEARIREISDEMRAIRADQEEQMEPIRDQIEQAQQQLHDGLLALLRDDQKERFEDLWETRLAGPFGRRPRERSPRALKAMIDKLNDLTFEQKEQIDSLFKAYQESAREVKGNRAASKKLTKKLYDDVFEVLTEEQRQKVEERLRGHHRRSHAGKRPRHPMPPRHLEEPGPSQGGPQEDSTEEPAESAQAAQREP